MSTVGSTIDISILRQNGSREDIGEIHNIIGEPCFSLKRQQPAVYNNFMFYALSGSGYVDLSGTYSQSGNVITRVTGSYPLNSSSETNLYVFGTGQRGYATTYNSVSSLTISRAQTVAPTTLRYYKTSVAGFGKNPTSDVSWSYTTASSTSKLIYNNGVITNYLSVSGSFAPAIKTLTLRTICVRFPDFAYEGSLGASIFNLPSAVNINIGDSILVNDYKSILTFDQYQPRTFSTSILSGVIGSGKLQRLSPAGVVEQTTDRIYLVSNANKLTLPDMIPLTGSYIAPSVLSAFETITATSTVVNPAPANNAGSLVKFYGSVITGGATKQIAWGNTTQLFGIIEYDTPQTITAGKIISLSATLQMEVEIPV